MWECESEGETRERQQSGSLEAVSLPPQARCVLVQSGSVEMKRELETAADCSQTLRHTEAKEEQYVFSLRSPISQGFFFFFSGISVYVLGFLLFLRFYQQSEEVIKPSLPFVFGENFL